LVNLILKKLKGKRNIFSPCLERRKSIARQSHSFSPFLYAKQNASNPFYHLDIDYFFILHFAFYIHVRQQKSTTSVVLL